MKTKERTQGKIDAEGVTLIYLNPNKADEVECVELKCGDDLIAYVPHYGDNAKANAEHLLRCWNMFIELEKEAEYMAIQMGMGVSEWEAFMPKAWHNSKEAV